MIRQLQAKLSWWTHHLAMLIFLRLAGQSVQCTVCGRELFRAIPFVRGGKVVLIGAEESEVRVAFKDKISLGFRHVELDKCPAPERPWVT